MSDLSGSDTVSRIETASVAYWLVIAAAIAGCVACSPSKWRVTAAATTSASSFVRITPCPMEGMQDNYNVWTSTLDRAVLESTNWAYAGMTETQLWREFKRMRLPAGSTGSVEAARLLQWCNAMYSVDTNYLCKLPMAIHGLVAEANGTPVPMATVSAVYMRTHAELDSKVATTDTNGVFAMDDFCHVPWLFVMKQGYTPPMNPLRAPGPAEDTFPAVLAVFLVPQQVTLKMENQAPRHGIYADMSKARLWAARPLWRSNATPQELEDYRQWNAAVEDKAPVLVCKAPIEFYGVVRDYDSNAVPNADVLVDWEGEGRKEFGITTDANGFFAITNMTGIRLTIQVDCDGYAGRITQSFEYGPLRGQGHIADISQPVVFRLMKKGALVPIVESIKNMDDMAVNDSIIWYNPDSTSTNLTNISMFGLAVPSATTNAEGQAVHYRLVFHAPPEAGIALANPEDKFMYLAPEDGYTNMITVEVERNPMRDGEKHTKMFIRTAVSNYAACVVSHEFNDKFHVLGQPDVHTYMNPTGSRNLTTKY